MGQYINDVGPQHTFVLPNGILRPHGHNTLAIAVTSDAPGAGLGNVKLVEPRHEREQRCAVHDVDSPAFAPPQLTPVPLTLRAGAAYSGPVATRQPPAGRAGRGAGRRRSTGATGTSSPGTIAGGTVTGTHTYAAPYAYPVKVTISDRYGAADLASSTELVQVPATATGTVGGTVPATLSPDAGRAGRRSARSRRASAQDVHGVDDGERDLHGRRRGADRGRPGGRRAPGQRRVQPARSRCRSRT